MFGKLACIFFSIFISKEVCSLTCLCTSNVSDAPCDPTGHCQVNGICVNVSQPGTIVRQCVANVSTTSLGCTTTHHEDGVTTVQCACNNQDNCNGNFTSIVGVITNNSVSSTLTAISSGYTVSFTDRPTVGLHNTTGKDKGGTGNWVQFSVYVMLVSLTFVAFL